MNLCDSSIKFTKIERHKYATNRRRITTEPWCTSDATKFGTKPSATSREVSTSKVIWTPGNIRCRCRGRTVKLRIRPDDDVTGHLPALVTYDNNCAGTVCTALLCRTSHVVVVLRRWWRPLVASELLSIDLRFPAAVYNLFNLASIVDIAMNFQTKTHASVNSENCWRYFLSRDMTILFTGSVTNESGLAKSLDGKAGWIEYNNKWKCGNITTTTNTTNFWTRT